MTRRGPEPYLILKVVLTAAGVLAALFALISIPGTGASVRTSIRAFFICPSFLLLGAGLVLAFVVALLDWRKESANRRRP